MNAVELRAIAKRYEGHVAVRSLSLQVPRGSVYGLLGPNGAGKTTTIRMLLNIIAPDEGSVLINGVSHTQKARDDVKEGIRKYIRQRHARD